MLYRSRRIVGSKHNEPNGQPVWLKGGKWDLYTYNAICCLILFGLINTFVFYYKLAYGLPLEDKNKFWPW